MSGGTEEKAPAQRRLVAVFELSQLSGTYNVEACQRCVDK